MKKALLLLFVISFNLSAQDTIRVGHKFKQFKNLEFGVTQDVIYTTVEGKVRNVMLMTRETKEVKIDGMDYISISHTLGIDNPDLQTNF